MFAMSPENVGSATFGRQLVVNCWVMWLLATGITVTVWQKYTVGIPQTLEMIPNDLLTGCCIGSWHQVLMSLLHKRTRECVNSWNQGWWPKVY